ncbi:MAG: LD-carboxypeptidase, partial [Omnitrophica WOR_2 bacterium]
MRLPERLHPGDTIGIFSPSSPVEKEAVEKMVQYFQVRGYTVKVAPNTLAKSGFMAGAPTQRASDL